MIESSRGYGRGLLRGVAKYLRSHGQWQILHQDLALTDSLPRWFAEGEYHGALVRLEHRSWAQHVADVGRPAVDLRGLWPVAGVPVIGPDDRQAVHLAIGHLRERGLRNLAFCGFGGLDFSERRSQYFAEELAALGLTARTHQSPRPPPALDTPSVESLAMASDIHLARWLLELPKPVGLVACNDVRGRQVLEVARRLGIRVPEQVAVVGIDDDDVLCTLAEPQMSSVIPATERIGFEAATLLDRMMAGETFPHGCQMTFPAIGVATRKSTDTLAIDDPQIAAAIKFIRHRSGAVTGEEVLDYLASNGAEGAVSRSTLDKRFGAHLGRSLKEEILRVRLERIKDLLLHTRHAAAHIARVVGMQHPEQLSAFFKRATGQTPGQFRSNNACTLQPNQDEHW
ncbi:MAG TPA: XylR family transcriptional regulator [Tepidisphaeraceae bacterium]|nr:XylR family transcriptional regulator [Tepidisphaeraceae bacterium]